MITKIRLIPQSVRRAALKHYNTKCRELHAIAFLQWRMRFPSTLMYDAEQLEELILARVNQVYSLEEGHAKEATKDGSDGLELPKNFLMLYDLCDLEPKMFNINSFQQIGMADPFPKEDVGFHAHIPEAYSDHVYPEQRMCAGDGSPMCIYIPSDIITLKLIRACMGVKTPEELWFNKVEEEPEEKEKKKKKPDHK